MNKREKQELIRELRQIRDDIQSILNDSASEPDWKQLRRYDAVAIKALAILGSALITLST